MYEDYADYEEVTYNNNYFDKKKIVLIVIILSLMIGGYFLYQIFFNRDYSYYEKKMVEDAKRFVEINNLNLSREIYLDISRIKTEIPTNCSNTSGVFYNGNTYKAYLSCSDYESKIIDNNSKEMNLLGNDIIILIKGMEYIEPGYISINDVKIDGDVGSEEGVYTVNYFSSNDVVTRKVVIINNMFLKRELPTLSLIGEKQVILKLKEEYMEQGVLASDDMDGNITSQVNIKSNVNYYQEGEYQTVYTVRNSRGYQNYIVRKINVIGDSNLNIISDLSNNNLTNQNVNIIINIVGDNYQYTILPNEEKKYEKNFEYEVKENGEYKFLVYDKNNQVIEKIIHVNNINRDKPNIYCISEEYPNYTIIKVTNNSNKIISNYKYVIDGIETENTINDSYYLERSNTNRILVEASDILGNMTRVSCELKKMDPTVGNNLVTYYNYRNEEYVVANTKNNLDSFQNRTCNHIAQKVDQGNCGDSCLSFALYYAAYMQYGNLSGMNQYDACNYNYSHLASFTSKAHATKKDALTTVYNEINNGKVLVLQVTGTPARNSRHFYTIVGYKRNKYHPEELTEEDLLGIDSWTGCFSTLSFYDNSKRTMFDNKDGYGYRIDVFKSKS